MDLKEELKKEVIEYFKGFEEGYRYTITIDFIEMVDAMINLLEEKNEKEK